jgi:hypothetical protein
MMLSLPTPSPFDLAITGIGGWLLISGAVSSIVKDRYYLSYASEYPPPVRL